MPMKAITVPMNEAQAEIDSATPPMPLRASGLPSIALMIAPASPGTFSRIDEMRPPNSQPR